ncbi:MAG: hypothetical protein OXE74_09105 [Cyanobacteria bacterium MAG CAR2_bin_4]|nr:hypothetical protein [Cyanobacteria bacterium MAG CAR2_bin_4]
MALTPVGAGGGPLTTPMMVKRILLLFLSQDIIRDLDSLAIDQPVAPVSLLEFVKPILPPLETESQYVVFAASTVLSGAVNVLTALAVMVAGAVRVVITVPVGSVPSARIVTTGTPLLTYIPTDEIV